MKTNLIRDRLQVLLATGALAIGFTSAAHAHVPPRYQIEADSAAATGESDGADQRIEKRIIVETDETDNDAPVAKQERRVIVRTQVDGDAEDNDGMCRAPNRRRLSSRRWVATCTPRAAPAKRSHGWVWRPRSRPKRWPRNWVCSLGKGLLVTYVATNSPAAKASLQKNDLLVEMDGQKLVLPGAIAEARPDAQRR